jgi:FkbM family methyltransferase
MMEFSFRKGTNDILIFEEIFRKNEYRLQETFAEDDILIDVGAHVGFFTCAAIEHGARTIYAIEADYANYQIAAMHLKAYIDQGVVDLRWGAVWRSDVTEQYLHHSGYNRNFDHPVEGIEINTGAGDVLWQTHGQKVPVIPFDELILQATQQGQKRIRLLKMDSEGSEWPILLTSKTLHLVDEIRGEFHEIGGAYDALQPKNLSLQGFDRFTIRELVKALEEKNFKTVYVRDTRANGSPAAKGMFFATRS